MASVQFYGLEKAIEAYKNCNVPAWGLFSGRQLLCKYTGDSIDEGAGLFEDFCEKIEHSTATYTLKVFEPEGNKPLKIKENTPCDSSFNFKILEEEAYLERRTIKGSYPYQTGGNKEIIEKLSGIEQRLNQIEEGPDDEDETIDWGKEILGLIREPQRLQQLVNVGRMALGQAPVSATTIGNTATTKPTIEMNIEEKLQRIGDAIETLEKTDKKIVEHLEKLAALSQSDPRLFNMLIKNLESL